MATKKGGLRDCEGWSRVEMNPGFHPCKAGVPLKVRTASSQVPPGGWRFINAKKNKLMDPNRIR